ncbi:hypothetical protein AB0H12_30945 [Actinosynnema sp. NPDC023794]
MTSLVSEKLNPTLDAVYEVFDLHTDSEREGTFRSAIHEEVVRAVGQVTASAVDFGPRGKLFSKLEITSVHEELRVQSISMSQKWQFAQLLEELFKKNAEVRVRILLIHPYSPHVPLREADIGFTPNTIRNLVEETILPLASLRSEQNVADRLQVRGYYSTPHYGLIVCDTTRCLVTLSREGRGGDQNFAIFFDGSTQPSASMIGDLEHGFDNRWEHSFNLMEPLILTVEVLVSTEKDKLSIKLVSEVPLDVPSIKFKCLNAVVESIENRGDSVDVELRHLGRSENIGVDVVRALSHDGHSWLAKPVGVVVNVHQ